MKIEQEHIRKGEKTEKARLNEVDKAMARDTLHRVYKNLFEKI